MRKGSFIYFTLIVFLLVFPVFAQRTPPGTPAERRQRRDEYNRRINDPNNNPYTRPNEADVRVDPKRTEKNGVLRLEPPSRNVFETEIMDVVDGDTIAIANSQNQRLLIRLLGIDAPELDQAFGAEARKNLADKISGKKVRILFEPHGLPDEEGRIVAKIFMDDRDICAEQVREGFAWYFDKHKERLGILEVDTFKELQLNAKKGKLQLWQDKAAQAPWKFRKINSVVRKAS